MPVPPLSVKWQVLPDWLVTVGCAWPLLLAVRVTVNFPAGVTKVWVAVFELPPPNPALLIEVFTGPLNTSEVNFNGVLLLLFSRFAAAPPLTTPVIVSVPELLPLAADEPEPSTMTRATAPLRVATSALI